MVKAEHSKRTALHLVGILLYLLWLMQWLWVAMLYIEPFFQTPLGKIIKPDTVPIQPVVPLESSTLSGGAPMSLLAPLAFVGGAVLLAVVAYVIARIYIPDVERTARKTVQKTTTIVTEQAIKHHVVTRKARRTAKIKVAFWIRIAFSLLPIVVVFSVPGSVSLVPREVAKIIILFLCVPALLLVIVQKTLTNRWHIIEDDAK